VLALTIVLPVAVVEAQKLIATRLEQ